MNDKADIEGVINMFNIAIVGDEKSSAELLTEFIRRYGDEEQENFNIEYYSNGILFLENYKMTLDLVIIDIDMPDFDGVETARQLREIDEKVCLILLISNPEQAICGYEADATEVILKPADYAQISVKMKKALKCIIKNRHEAFLLKYEGDLIRINYKELLYIEVQNHWLIFHLVLAEYKVRGNLGKIKGRFINHGFAQCNSCYLVNLDYVDRISGNIAVVGKKELQISHARKKEFISTFSDYMQSSGIYR